MMWYDDCRHGVMGNSRVWSIERCWMTKFQGSRLCFFTHLLMRQRLLHLMRLWGRMGGGVSGPSHGESTLSFSRRKSLRRTRTKRGSKLLLSETCGPWHTRLHHPRKARTSTPTFSMSLELIRIKFEQIGLHCTWQEGESELALADSRTF